MQSVEGGPNPLAGLSALGWAACIPTVHQTPDFVTRPVCHHRLQGNENVFLQIENHVSAKARGTRSLRGRGCYTPAQNRLCKGCLALYGF